jgi:hypothetical protein
MLWANSPTGKGPLEPMDRNKGGLQGNYRHGGTAKNPNSPTTNKALANIQKQLSKNAAMLLFQTFLHSNSSLK